MPPAALIGPVEPEASAPVAARIADARRRQARRSGEPAERPGASVARSARRAASTRSTSARAIVLADREGLSGRGTERLLRVARTIADLAGDDAVDVATTSTRRHGTGRPWTGWPCGRRADAGRGPGGRLAPVGGSARRRRRRWRTARRRGVSLAVGAGEPRGGRAGRVGRARLRPRRRPGVVRAADRGVRGCRNRAARRRGAARSRAPRRGDGCADDGLAVALAGRRAGRRGRQRATRRGASTRSGEPASARSPSPIAAYPARLRRIDLPPPVLYVARIGRRRWIVPGRSRSSGRGGRRRSGGRRAARIADAIAGLGATVVSGLALGIDAAAHAAAVRAGGTTVAVIGGGPRAPLSGRRTAALARSIVDERRRGDQRVRARTRRRPGARSRGATGSSAASPTRRSWSRPVRAAAP